MALAKNVMHGGFSAGQAQAVNGNTVNGSITAAGTTQGGATALTADVNVVTTATSGQGVILYAGVPGDNQWVFNNTSVDIRVYPHTGAKVNQVATNSAFVLAPYTAVDCMLVSSTQWVALLSG